MNGAVQSVLTRCPSHRHIQGVRPTRTLCGASIAWVNIPTRPELATCPQCLRMVKP